jgi:hypothetical protein
MQCGHITHIGAGRTRTMPGLSPVGASQIQLNPGDPGESDRQDPPTVDGPGPGGNSAATVSVPLFEYVEDFFSPLKSTGSSLE